MLEKLRKKLEEILNSMKTLSDAVVAEDGKVRSFSTDEDAKYKALEADAKATRAAIARAEQEEEARAVVARLDEPETDAPRIQIKREHNHNEQGEYRGFRSFGENLRAIAYESLPGFESKRDKRMRELQNSTEKQLRASGQSEGIGSEGGFFVQSDFEKTLQTKSFEASVFAPQCENITVQGNAYEWVEIVEDSRVTGSRNGGVRVFRDKEAGTVTSSKVQLRKDKLALEKMTAIGYMPEELLEDAPALQSSLEGQFIKEFAYVLDEELVTGDGDGECFGVLNHPSLVVISKESAQAASTVLFANVSKMNEALYAGSEANAKWYVGVNVRPQLEQMAFDPAATSKTPVFLPAGGVSTRGFASLYDKPLSKNEHMLGLTSQGDILLADWSQYRLVKKGGIQGSTSIHVRFLNGEVAFRWVQRVNGKPKWRNALTSAKGSQTQGPFVTLQNR